MKTETVCHTVISHEIGAMGSDSLPRVNTKTNRSSGCLDEGHTRWVFELKDDGTVLYSRPHILTDGEQEDGLEGQNFFDEIAGFEDIAKYRQHFQSFVKSNKAVDSFIWRRSSAGKRVDTRVLMTRAYQTGGCPPTGVVMM